MQPEKLEWKSDLSSKIDRKSDKSSKIDRKSDLSSKIDQKSDLSSKIDQKSDRQVRKSIEIHFKNLCSTATLETQILWSLFKSGYYLKVDHESSG